MNRTENFDLQFLAIDTEVLNRIIKAANNLVGNPDPSRKGGYLALYGINEKISAAAPAGEFPEDMRFRFLTNASEKLTRCLKFKLIRSFESRNVENGQYGGGIVLKHFAIAFSGYDEKIDEAIALVYGLYHTMFYSKHESDERPTDSAMYFPMLMEQVIAWQKLYAPENQFCIPLAKAMFEG
ncbi:MAG: hypothetical protein KA028_01970 [Candidatus Pacebacteria bacterium]|nr:hypothetical protein [Candidatus Paceibacterota bacterium]MBP9851678.1 hypothetical protein [Candidatus Paceibacterota bacterium]